MNDERVKIEPDIESFRGYAVALDRELEAGGSVAILFIAFANMSGADVDKVFVKEDFERFMEATAAEYNGKVKKLADYGNNKIGFGAITNEK